MRTGVDPERYKTQERAIYDHRLLDDLQAGAGYYGFNKPKTIRDCVFQSWLEKLALRQHDKLLDVGCNAGARLEQLRRQFGIQGYGIDLSNETIRIGKRFFPHLKLVVGDAEYLPFADQEFDAVISFETFEHLPNPHQAFAEINRVLKPGGKMLIYAISRRNALTLHWWQYHLSGGRYGKGTVDDHLPELLIAPESVKAWIKDRHLILKGWLVFHSFFTIIHDEFLVHLLSITVMALQKKPKKPIHGLPVDYRSKPRLPSKQFSIYRGWLTMMERLLWLLDSPWRWFGLGDGLLVLLEKPKR